MEITRELIHRSRQWTSMSKVRDVLYDACDLLENHFQIETGYFLYYQPETNVGMQYAWGITTPTRVLHAAIQESLDFLPNLQTNQGQWLSTQDVPQPWCTVMCREKVHEVAGWLITINDNIVGLFALGRRTMDTENAGIISLSMAHITLMVEMIIYRRTAESHL